MIEVDISRCTGCRMCETACAFYHSGAVNRHKARIKVVNLYTTGIDGPVLCQQCRERYCTDCPADALTIGPLGEISVSPTLCTLCKTCEKNCPIGAIEVFEEIVHVCDLCGGSPRCVDACTEGAIVFTPGKKETVSLAKEREETKTFSTSQRRSHYIGRLGETPREKWRS